MRILFMGSGEFAVPTLQALIESDHEVVCLVTQPDKPAGRGRKLRMPPTKETALGSGIDVYQPRKVREAGSVEKVTALAPECIVVVAYGQIIPQSILDIPPKGIINVHGSLLPALRGAAPIQWAIVKGETKTGVTTMLMDRGLDTGPILLKTEMEIFDNDTADSLSRRMAPLGAALLMKTLDPWFSGTLEPTPQNDLHATKAPLIKVEHAQVNWSDPASSITNQIRGFNPWPVAQTDWRGHRLKLWEGTALPDEPGRDAPGTILATSGEAAIIQCGKGHLRLTEVQAEGKKRMSAGDFARGQRVEPNERLGVDSVSP